MIIIEPYSGVSVAEQRVEIVERKGTGHPDYICDAIMESISVALSREYLAACGAILHHNIDKGLLVAGGVNLEYGGGRVTSPMELVIGDRATFEAGGKRLPIGEIAVEAARQWIRGHLRFVDPEEHVKYRLVLAPGSEELTDIFSRPGDTLAANDTSAAVGYYPLSPTEKAVLDLERYVNSADFKRKFPQTGEDVKVMGLRNGDGLDLTLAMPLISRFVVSEGDYFAQKEALLADVKRHVRENSPMPTAAVHFNTLDEPGRGLGGIYLTLTGTSAEAADSGQVGRGNRVNGLIALNRPMGTEAAAGKNPVSHVGKIYNVLSHKIAQEIHERVEGLREVYVMLLSRIGTPIDRPQMAAVRLLPERGRRVREIAGEVEAIVAGELAGISNFCRALGRGEYPVC